MSLESISPALPATLEDLLSAGTPALDLLRSASKRARRGVLLDDVHLLAPIRHPQKFLGIGLNYQDHAEEMRSRGRTVPQDLRNQIWFNKQVSCIAGPYDPIHLPMCSEQLDFEAELGVVIGKRCRHVTRERAHEVIAGYLVVNDVSVRDWQHRSPTATLGKSFDTHGPIGPWLTTAEEIPDPHALAILTVVDGTVMQRGHTSNLINSIAEMVVYLTTVMTLWPGDILATGTPSGVAQGRAPPPWLRVGQLVRVEIEGLGFIENRVVPEPLTQTTVMS